VTRAAVRAAIIALLALLPTFAVYAHPHVFIDCTAGVTFSGDSVSGLHFEWVFDELFSQMIVADFDRAGKGYFTPAEAVALRKGAFDNLKNYHYFLAIFVDGARKPLPGIANFKPSIRNGKLVYDFDVPLAISVPPSGREIRVTVYDDTYYTAFDKMSPGDVSVPEDDSIVATVSIEKTKAKAEWPGQWMPDQIVLRLKRK